MKKAPIFVLKIGLEPNENPRAVPASRYGAWVYEYLLQALENFVQLVNVGKDIVGLALGLVDHLLIRLA